ncbi:MAG: DNA starvation/stationary phase protection protein [Candidatus Eremiobacteraeota bacterium]|nr:DNA starvation/stationary phase protection protein [Candidatus Eremiobacteraeota bacterium]
MAITKTRPGTSAAAATNGKKKPTNGAVRPPDKELGIEIQRFGDVIDRPIKLDEDERSKSCDLMNGVLADTQILYALYKKHHWLMRGHTFYQLHLLLDKHAEEQQQLADDLAERIQKLGGIAVGDPRHVAELTDIPRPPDGAESVPAMPQRLLDAHELTIARVRDGIEKTDDGDDQGTNDLLVSQVLRTNETHVWYIAEHLVDTPVVDGMAAGN